MQYADASGWRVSAFGSVAPPERTGGGQELLEKLRGDTRIYYVPAADFRPAWSFFPSINGNFSDALVLAKYAGRALDRDPPDAVLASGPPFDVFVAARLVAKHFEVPLVLDYRDEWTECPFSFVALGRNDQWWERRCLSAADAVIFTTLSQLEHQLTTFENLKRIHAHVIPNGWDTSDFPVEHRLEASGNSPGVLHLAFVGNLSAHSPPSPFLVDLSKLIQEYPSWANQLRIDFIGRKSRDAAAALVEFPFACVINAVDQVKKSDAAERMRNADGLLLFAVPELCRYLPGKLFEYIAARKPIIVYGHEGEASRLVRELSVGIFCREGDLNGLRAAFQDVINGKLAMRSDTVERWLHKHSRDQLAERLFSVIDATAKR